MTKPNISSLPNILKAVLALKLVWVLGPILLMLSCGGVVAALGIGGLIWTDARWRTALETVVEAPAHRVDPQLEGALVHVVAETSTEHSARDEPFLISRPNAVALVRVVETWQWVESTESTTTGSGSNRRTTSRKVYEQEWSEGLLDSSEFYKPDGHTNPDQVAYKGLTVLGNGARLGAYQLTMPVVDALPSLDPLVLSEPDAARAEGRLLHNRIHLHDNPRDPGLGDQRISYRLLSPGVLTVMAMQQDDQLHEWRKMHSMPVLLAHPGEMTATEMVWVERREGLFAGGVLAGLGGFVCCFGMVPVFLMVGLAWLLFVVSKRGNPTG